MSIRCFKNLIQLGTLETLAHGQGYVYALERPKKVRLNSQVWLTLSLVQAVS